MGGLQIRIFRHPVTAPALPGQPGVSFHEADGCSLATWKMAALYFTHADLMDMSTVSARIGSSWSARRCLVLHELQGQARIGS
jgi:hypothetical protein